jgi:hypothetical protein
MRKIVSRRIAWFPGAWGPPIAIVPIASTTTSPRRLTRVTSPGRLPRSTWRAMTSCMRPSRAAEKPPLPIALTPPSP